MNILVLAANPKDTSQLRLAEEVREIQLGLERSKQRDSFVLKQRWAVRTDDLRRAMLDEAPRIVHFSGHGTGDRGLILEDNNGQAQLVNTNALMGLFKLFANQVECVILNACYSSTQVESIVQHID